MEQCELYYVWSRKSKPLPSSYTSKSWLVTPWPSLYSPKRIKVSPQQPPTVIRLYHHTNYPLSFSSKTQPTPLTDPTPNPHLETLRCSVTSPKQSHDLHIHLQPYKQLDCETNTPRKPPFSPSPFLGNKPDWWAPPQHRLTVSKNPNNENVGLLCTHAHQGFKSSGTVRIKRLLHSVFRTSVAGQQKQGERLLKNAWR